jgi:hypothetical protein
MTQKTTFPPDLLRRFAPAPYVFSIVHDHQRVWIEANDLEVALAIRRSCMLQSKESRTRVLFWKLIRDSASPRGGSEILIFVNGPHRALHLGVGTIIIYDTERSELLGFIAHDIDSEQLVTALIPLLTSRERWPKNPRVVFTKK